MPSAPGPISDPGLAALIDIASREIALVALDDGLAGVAVGTSVPLWTVPGAVFVARAPAHGGAGAAVDGVEVVGIDPRTGLERPGRVLVPGPAGPTGPAALRVAAVAPGGARVALIAPGAETTVLIDVEVATASVLRRSEFEGVVEPEAFSLDASLLYAARIYGDSYHVHVLDPATGEQWPTSSRYKRAKPEEMYGSVVQAALSPDRTQLATLYRDVESADHTAFVHLLALDTGLTTCIDLHAPFGSDIPGSDAIAWLDDGSVSVGHSADDPSQSMSATFDPAAIVNGEPQPHYHADAQPDPRPIEVPAGVAATPGFQRFITLAS